MESERPERQACRKTGTRSLTWPCGVGSQSVTCDAVEEPIFQRTRHAVTPIDFRVAFAAANPPIPGPWCVPSSHMTVRRPNRTGLGEGTDWGSVHAPLLMKTDELRKAGPGPGPGPGRDGGVGPWLPGLTDSTEKRSALSVPISPVQISSADDASPILPASLCLSSATLSLPFHRSPGTVVLSLLPGDATQPGVSSSPLLLSLQPKHTHGSIEMLL